MTDTIIEKDTILVTIGEDHSFNCSVVTIGRTGENAVSQLEIEIPKELASFDAFLEFKKPKGQTTRTPKITVQNNRIEYDIPQSLLDENGNIEVQLILQGENGEIWKSATKKYVVLKSIDAGEDIPDSQKEDFFSEAQRTMDNLASVCAPVIKETVVGSAVSMPDVSPLEHNIVVKLKSDTITDFSSVTLKKCGKNFLDLTSLIGKSVTANGGTLSCGADGGIRGSGTVSGYVGFNSFRLYLPKGKYILSASGTFSNISCAIVLNDENGKVLQEAGVVSSGGGFSFNTENYPSFAYITVTIKRNNNVALSGTAYFQIELGTKATEYEPYKESIPYTAKADGTVEGVTSIYPTTTLLTDTEGVTITAEYNCDTKKYIDKKLAQLVAATVSEGVV